MAVWRFQPRITSENATGANLGDQGAILGVGLPAQETKNPAISGGVLWVFGWAED